MVAKVRIVVDSALDIPEELLQKYEITQVPVLVNWKGRQYHDKVDLDLDDLFREFSSSDSMPATSQPSPGEFAAAYQKVDADLILSFHIAAGLSGTYSSAVAGSKLVARDIRVFDTRSVSMGGGLQAVAAAEALAQGFSIEQIVRRFEQVREATDVHIVLDTLEYVLKGGRVSRLEAALGSLLNIKPLLKVQDSKLISVGRTRSRRRSLQHLLDTVVAASATSDGSGFHVALGQGGAEEDQQWFAQALKGLLPKTELINYKVGIAIGAHGGPGVLGACYYNLPRD